MALVVTHTEFPDLQNAAIGRFLNDGKEYLAYVRDNKYLDFYSFPHPFTRVKSVLIPNGGKKIVFGIPEAFNISNNCDHILLSYGEEKSMFMNMLDQKMYWNGYTLTPLAPKELEVRYSPPPEDVAPGIWADNEYKVHKGDKVLLEPNLQPLKSEFFILDSELVAYTNSIEVGFEEVHYLYVMSILSKEIVSRWKLGTGPSDIRSSFAYNVCYATLNDRSKLLVNGDKWTLIDISSPEAVKIADLPPPCALPNKIFGAFDFLYYEPTTGSPVFTLSLKAEHSIGQPILDNHLFLSFTDNKFIGMSIFEAKLTFIKNKYFVEGSNIYEAVLMGNKWTLQLRNSVPWLDGVEHTYRDLAGTTYFDKNGMFRESWIYKTSTELLLEPEEAPDDIFWVGKDVFLVAGTSRSVVINAITGAKVNTWHRSEPTLFASSKFQVTDSKIYTPSGEMLLPYPDVYMFAVFDDKLIAANISGLLIVSENLQIELINDMIEIESVFSGGSVTPGGIKFFYNNNRDILRRRLSEAVVIGKEVFAKTSTGKLINARTGVRVDLNLDSVTEIYDCGAGTIIHGTDNSYLYSNGEFSSINLDSVQKILVSDDRKYAVSMKNGLLYREADPEFQLLKKPIDNVLDYGHLHVFQNKVLCSKTNMNGRTNLVFLRNLKGGVIKTFEMPKESLVHEYYLLSHEYFVDFCKTKGTLKLFTVGSPGVALKNIDHCLGKYACSAKASSDGKLFICASYVREYQLFVYQIRDGDLVQTAHRKYVDEDSDYDFRLWPNNYTKPGDHWLLFEDSHTSLIKQPLQTVIELYPASQAFNVTPEMRKSMIEESDKISCARVNSQFPYYHAAYCHFRGLYIFQINLDNTKKELTAVNVRADSVNYITNHGSETEYELHFAATGRGLLTVTILSLEEAQSLYKIQCQLLGNKNEDKPNLDGRFLLKAASDPANTGLFLKNRIDPKRLKDDLWNLIK